MRNEFDPGTMRMRGWARRLPAGAFSQLLATAGSRFPVDFSGSAGALAEPRERVENLLAIHLGFPLAESGDVQKFAQGTGTLSAQLIERCVVHHHIGRNAPFFRRGAPPFAKVFAEFRVNI